MPEIYLTRASLSATTALDDVNKVRVRAGLEELTSVTESDIENERIKELGFETCDRLNYLIANSRPLDGDKGINSMDGNKSDPMGGNKIRSINYPYSDMYIPLPPIEFLYSGTASEIGY